MSWFAPACAAVACLALAVVTSGCESTQAKSERLAKEGGKGVAAQKGLKIEGKSKNVSLVESVVLKDANGIAAVAVLRNKSSSAVRNVPLAIDVKGAGGKSMFQNNEPGLDAGLVSIASLAPKQTVAWVNDQVLGEGTPKSVDVTVGAEKGQVSGGLPKVDIGKPKLGGDPTSGIAAEGNVVNRDKADQRFLVIYAVARKGGKIVAAGRGQIERLRAGKKAAYQIFFIGNPKGAELEVVAPPIVGG